MENDFDHQNVKFASFSQRLTASILDGLILTLIGIGISFALGNNPFNATIRDNQTSLDYLISLFISIAYDVGFLVKQNGQTPGKRMMHIRVTKESGGQIDLFTAVIRYISKWVSIIPLALGYIWVLFDKKRQGWHDKIAKTYVVKSDDKPVNKLVVTIINLLPLLIIIPVIASVVFGLYSIANESKSNKKSAVSYKKSEEEMKPEAKKHFDKSQELFKQMNEASNDPSKVRTLNDENIAELKKALEIEPNNARLWSDLGSAYTWISNTGKLEDGLAAYGKAEELEPDNIFYVTSVGDMLSRLGKYQDAILQLQKALRMSDNYAYPEYLIGVSYKELKIYDQARTHLEKAIEIYTNANKDGQFDDKILLTQQQLSGVPK